MEEIRYEDIPVNQAKPLVGINPFDDVAAEVLHKPLTFKAIDYIRPDWALLRGIQFQQARRAGRTGWRPTPRTPRTPGKYRAKAEAGRYHRKHQS